MKNVFIKIKDLTKNLIEKSKRKIKRMKRRFGVAKTLQNIQTSPLQFGKYYEWKKLWALMMMMMSGVSIWNNMQNRFLFIIARPSLSLPISTVYLQFDICGCLHVFFFYTFCLRRRRPLFDYDLWIIRRLIQGTRRNDFSASYVHK